MYLVLCSAHDCSARWAYEELRGRRLAPLEFVTTEQLAFGRLWEHRVGESRSSVRIVLGDGRTIWSDKIHAVLNRLVAAPGNLVNFGRREDRDYAMQELSSFYLSWLRALPGVVINRPEPQGFCGRWRHLSEWAVLAQKAGLPAPRYRQCVQEDPSRNQGGLAPVNAEVISVIALRGKLFGADLPVRTGAACCRFAELAGYDLMGLRLFRNERGTWNFASATPYPEFTCGGAPLIEHMAAVFQTEVRT